MLTDIVRLILILQAGGATVTVLRTAKKGVVIKVERAGFATVFARVKKTSIVS